MIANQCDAYVMHGDPVEAIAPKIADMTARREAAGGRRCTSAWPPMRSCATARTRPRRELERITALPPEPPAGFDNFDQWLSGTQLERELKIQEYSVSNRGLRPEPGRHARADPASGSRPMRRPASTSCSLQMSPQDEEMDRFAEQVIAPMKGLTALTFSRCEGGQGEAARCRPRDRMRGSELDERATPSTGYYCCRTEHGPGDRRIAGQMTWLALASGKLQDHRDMVAPTSQQSPAAPMAMA